MGGQITRAIYRNERRTVIKDNPSYGNKIKELSVKFTQVLTTILVFVVGYLYRPYLHFQNTTQNEIISLVIIGFINLAAWYLSKRKCQDVNKQKHNQKFNQQFIKYWNFVILVAVIILLIFDIIQGMILDYEAIFKSQFIFIMSVVYRIILLASLNTSVYCISEIRSFQKIKNPSLQSTIRGVQRTMINFNQNVYLNRTLFLFVMLQVFKKGVQISTAINQYKNDPQIYKHAQGTQLYFETFSLRIVFCGLIFMISAVCIALQKKSLVYMRLNYQMLFKQKGEQNKQKKSLFNLAFSTFMFVCLMFLLVNRSFTKLSQNQHKVQLLTSIALVVVSVSLCTVLIKSAKKIVKYKTQSQQAFLINLLILIISIIHFYIPQNNIQMSTILKMSLAILLIYRFVNVWNKNNTKNSAHQIILNIVIFVSIGLITISQALSRNILKWCQQYFELTQSNKQANSLLIVLSCFLILYSLLNVLFDIISKEQQQKSNFSSVSINQHQEEKDSIFSGKKQNFTTTKQ